MVGFCELKNWLQRLIAIKTSASIHIMETFVQSADVSSKWPQRR